MIKVRKYIILNILLISLTIPIFFSVYLEYFIIRELNWFVILIFIIGVLMLLFFGKIVEIYGYNDKVVKIIRKQDVINALITRNNIIIIWFFFPIIIIIEELIFRYYLIGLLINQSYLGDMLVILISSLIFSIFHIHTWFSYKSIRILVIYVSYSFLLGLYNGYILLTLGIIPCVIIHYSLAYVSYHGIYVRYFKKSSM